MALVLARSHFAAIGSSAIALSLIGVVGVHAEGAVSVLDCRVTRVCDGAGQCEPGAGSVRFRMEPKDLGAGGAGHYTLRYGDVSTDMNAPSEAGPFVWSLGNERHALLASSETEWLWHALTLEPEPKATIRFLSCSFER